MDKLAANPTLNRRVRLRYDQTRQTHVLLQPETVMLLSDSAAEILTLCSGDISAQDLITTLHTRYPEAPAEELKSDVVAFLQDAESKKWITWGAS